MGAHLVAQLALPDRTNAALDVIRRRERAPVLPMDQGSAASGGWDFSTARDTESVLWLQPLPDDGYEQRESVALQHLPRTSARR